MPVSANAQLNTWADQRTRVIADKVTQLRYAIDAYLNDYTAAGIAGLITANSSAEAPNFMGIQDGRAPIIGTQILNQKAGLVALQTALEVTTVAGVGTTNAVINDAIQVNGSPR